MSCLQTAQSRATKIQSLTTAQRNAVSGLLRRCHRWLTRRSWRLFGRFPVICACVEARRAFPRHEAVQLELLAGAQSARHACDEVCSRCLQPNRDLYGLQSDWQFTSQATRSTTQTTRSLSYRDSLAPHERVNKEVLWITQHFKKPGTKLALL